MRSNVVCVSPLLSQCVCCKQLLCHLCLLKHCVSLVQMEDVTGQEEEASKLNAAISVGYVLHHEYNCDVDVFCTLTCRWDKRSQQTARRSSKLNAGVNPSFDCVRFWCCCYAKIVSTRLSAVVCLNATLLLCLSLFRRRCCQHLCVVDPAACFAFHLSC